MEPTIESQCQDARQSIADAQNKISGAWYLAEKDEQWELHKSLETISRLLGEVSCLLITVPRLRDPKELVQR